MNRDQVMAASGVAAVLVTLSAVVLATLVSPDFAWTMNALSDLGVTTTDAGTQATVFIFNGGLVFGSLLGLVFAVLRWRRARWGMGRFVAVLFGVTMAAMGGVGLFPAGTALHLPTAVTFYALVTATLWADAWDAGGGPGGRRGAVTTWLGATNAAAWIIWAVTGPVRRPGLALPEVVGALVLSAWVLTEAMRYSNGTELWGGERLGELSR